MSNHVYLTGLQISALEVVRYLSTYLYRMSSLTTFLLSMVKAVMTTVMTAE